MIDDTEYEPSTIAWKLLVDDDIKQYKGELMLIDSSDAKTHNNEFVFETLVLIFINMVFQLNSINETDYMTEQLFDKMENTLIEKFRKINFHIFIAKLEEPNYYCRITLKQDDPTFFYIHPEFTELFHILINASYKKVFKFEDILSKLCVNSTNYIIHFAKIIN